MPAGCYVLLSATEASCFAQHGYVSDHKSKRSLPYSSNRRLLSTALERTLQASVLQSLAS